MTIEYTSWPSDSAEKYRKLGYWIDSPLTDISTTQANNDDLAVIDGDQQVSYRELNSSSDRLAAASQRRGLRPYDTALVHLGNTLDSYVVFFASLKIGVVPVNALFSHRQLELTSYAEHIQPKLLIGDRENPSFKDDEFLRKSQGISQGSKTYAFRNEASGNSSKHLCEESSDGLVSTPTNDVAFFNSSGGSTGTPKLIPRTHNDYYYSVRQSVKVCRFDKNTRYLVAIPAAHNFPMSSPGSLGTFYANGTVVSASDPSSTSCFPLIQKHKVTVAALVPPAAASWLQDLQTNYSNTSEAPLASLKMSQLGGARSSPTSAGKLAEHFSCMLQQVFGMAEGLVNYTHWDDDEAHILTTQGRPMSPDDEVWVAGPNGEKLETGEVGLLMTRGPYTFRGYYNTPEHNAKSFDKDGFYCSGDSISIDSQGFITVHGRQKDQINRGGEKISAEEIENLLLRHPDIIEAGLVAVEDELMGEKSVAFIVARRPVKNVVLRKFLREQGIAEYKLPDKFETLEEMPLTAVGKVDKKKLRSLK